MVLQYISKMNYLRGALKPLSSLSLSKGYQLPFIRPSFIRFLSTQQFEEAKSKLNSLSEAPGNDVKLKLYGLYKQATEGSVTTKRPGMVDFVARAKWDAWSLVSAMNQEEAQLAYIGLVNSLTQNVESESPALSTSDQKYKYILVELDGGLLKITLNRPNKMNALVLDMYEEIVTALAEAKEDSKTVLTVLTGSGSYYCSGNDLSNFANVTPDKMQEMSGNAEKVLKRFVGAFIDFNKPLVAVINGPAVGISVTILGLFDAVYATDKATFHTPFSALGQTPEGCSSYVFPQLMGYGKSSELLMFNKKITAAEACKLNLVTEVFPDNRFQADIWPRLQDYAKLPPQSVIYSKQLMRCLHSETLHKVNAMECERLRERWTSEECINAIVSFFSRKK